jgi:hypothetical protein
MLLSGSPLTGLGRTGGDGGGYSGILSQNTIAMFFDIVFPTLNILLSIMDNF